MKELPNGCFIMLDNSSGQAMSLAKKLCSARQGDVILLTQEEQQLLDDALLVKTNRTVEEITF